MINLLSNAIKYTATSSRVTVSYRVTTRGEAVVEARHALCSDLLLAEAAAASAAAMSSSLHGSGRRRRNSSAASAGSSADAGADVAVQRSDDEPVVVVTIADQGKGLPVAVCTAYHYVSPVCILACMHCFVCTVIKHIFCAEVLVKLFLKYVYR
jgi:signal transduction histidine kinase